MWKLQAVRLRQPHAKPRDGDVTSEHEDTLAIQETEVKHTGQQEQQWRSGPVRKILTGVFMVVIYNKNVASRMTRRYKYLQHRTTPVFLFLNLSLKMSLSITRKEKEFVLFRSEAVINIPASPLWS